MTVRELLKDLQENFADYMDLEVRLGIEGRGDHKAYLPVVHSAGWDAFVSIPAQPWREEDPKVDD